MLVNMLLINQKYFQSQTQQNKQQILDNLKIQFISENQRMLGYKINHYSLTKYELDLFYKKLYRELEEHYDHDY